MPKNYLKMKKKMEYEYGVKKGDLIAVKTWNKRMKGTGQTVGRGKR